MNRNLFLKEMHKNVVSLIIWMAIITLLITITMSVYRTFMENQSKITDMLSIVPKSALQFKGISNFSDLLSVLGFYSVNNIIYMMVLGSIYSVVIGSNILLKEEYDKTAEYLFTRPLTRNEIFFSKLSVIITNVFLLNFVTALAGFICIEIVRNGPFNAGSFLILSIYTLLLNMLFAAAGLFMSTLIKRAKPITTLGIGLVLILYFIFTLSKITPGAAKLGYLSPFKFASVDAMNPSYRLDFFHLLYFLGISFLLLILSYRVYVKKDIYV